MVKRPGPPCVADGSCGARAAGSRKPAPRQGAGYCQSCYCHPDPAASGPSAQRRRGGLDPGRGASVPCCCGGGRQESDHLLNGVSGSASPFVMSRHLLKNVRLLMPMCAAISSRVRPSERISLACRMEMSFLGTAEDLPRRFFGLSGRTGGLPASGEGPQAVPAASGAGAAPLLSGGFSACWLPPWMPPSGEASWIVSRTIPSAREKSSKNPALNSACWMRCRGGLSSGWARGRFQW